MPTLIVNNYDYHSQSVLSEQVHDQIDQAIDLYYSDAVKEEPRSVSIKSKKLKKNLD